MVLKAANDNLSCDAENSVIIDVRCPVQASFTMDSRKVLSGETAAFTNTSTFSTNSIYRFNLEAGNPGAVRASRQEVAKPLLAIWGFQLGPDRRIYAKGLGALALGTGSGHLLYRDGNADGKNGGKSDSGPINDFSTYAI